MRFHRLTDNNGLGDARSDKPPTYNDWDCRKESVLSVCTVRSGTPSDVVVEQKRTGLQGRPHHQREDEGDLQEIVLKRQLLAAADAVIRRKSTISNQPSLG